MLGFVVRRLRGRLPLAAAVLLTVLITTTVLTALLAFNQSVGEAGLRRTLQAPGQTRTTVLVAGEHPAAARGKDDEAVRAFSDEVFGRLPVTVESVARSRSYGLPGVRTPGRDADLTLLAALARDRVRLVSGQWPEPAAAPGGRVQAAVPQAALTRLGLAPSALPAEVRLDDRYGGAPLTVVVTGVYRAADPDAAYWRLDPLGGREFQVGSFTTYGPLLVDDTVFGAGGLVQNSRDSLLTADFATVRVAETRALRDRAAGAADALAGASGLHARTELPELLGELESGLLVARSTLLVGALQLTVLAAAALLLVSHLLTGRQETERLLLAARGASRRRLGALTAAEGLLLALPAAVLAPLLTPPLLRLLAGFGPLSRVPLDSSGTWLLWPVAAGCALACVLLTALPAVLRGAAAAALRRARGRQVLTARATRSGADLALVVLAVLAYQQLSRYNDAAHGSGRPGGSGASGALGIDPVLVAAPSLALCAGTLLVLRLLPFAAARLGGRLAARGRGLGPALVGWQLARRPGRATGPVLLLVLAVSSGVLALGQQSAWSASQRDQAEFATAGGLRISGADLSAMGQGGRYAALPGGERVIPVIREQQELVGGTPAELLALDAGAVAERVPLRADLRDGRPMAQLFTPLAAGAGTPAADGVVLPGTPVRIDVDVTLRGQQGSNPGISLLLRDRFGLTFRTPMMAIPADGEATLSAHLGALTDAPVGSAAAPLSLVGMAVGYSALMPEPGEFRVSAGELAVRRISASDTASGAAVPLPPSATSGWKLSAPTLKDGAAAAQLPGATDGSELLRMSYRGGADALGDAGIMLTPAAMPPASRELPGIATPGYLDAVGAKVGDTIPVRFGVSALRVRVTAAVSSLPVAGDTALAVDLAALGRMFAAENGRALPPPTEWWLPAASADDPRPAQAAAELRSGAGLQKVQLREEVAAELLDDPLSAGPQSALAALAVACAVLAAIGFAASSAAAARERTREFTVLSALGAPRRSLARTTAAESLLLVGLGSAVGVGLGAAIVHLVVPLMVLTPAGRRPLPPVVVDLPDGRTLLLAVAIAVLPLLSALAGGRRDRNVAARLRYVEEI
ncbi:ABC transporter permease [Streptomyces sp. NBC_01443]|uniref:FtsX-like permease family protein n=1 Tax=Streptomyces sp. NBC_01443 TaxID=2903868 RepID=UPI0022521251|nr:ABC transporter permease [Streptomyces sp. NBC_01443]MCX4631619.1 ABC transporter permease [Streptomyces sp. NBC_01443]